MSRTLETTSEKSNAIRGLSATKRYVELLTGDAGNPLSWRLIHDSDKSASAFSFDSSLEDLVDSFLERQDDGYGVFAVVNRGGHRDAHIDLVRAVFIDGDDVPLPNAWHIEPRFIVQRDATHWHAYWAVEAMTVEQFTEVQRRLAIHYGTDPTISNPSRVMRVPGFVHLKNPANPHDVTLTELGTTQGGRSVRFEYEEIVTELPEVPHYVTLSRKHDPNRDRPVCELDLPHNVELAERFLVRSDASIAGSKNGPEGKGGNGYTYDIACMIRDFGISEALCNEIILHSEWNTERCEPAWAADELADVITNAYRYGENRPGCKRALLSRLRDFNNAKPMDLDDYAVWREGWLRERAYLADMLRKVRENPFIVEPENLPEWFWPVASLNERFAIVTGGKQAGRIADLANPREPVFLDATRFHLLFRDRKTTPPEAEAKPVPVSKLWEAWRGRRTVTGIEFVPPGARVKLTEGAHNLWRGFAVEPKEGDAHKPLLRHLYKHVCHRDGDLYRWLVAWLANLIQEPGHKPGVAIALHGEQGAGKTILYRYLETIFGGHAAAVDSPSLVVGNFNAHMAGLCLLGVEEGFWAGDPKAESKLKNLITAESIMMEQKGVDAIKINSHIHLMVTSNAAWVVPVAADDRRWAVFHVDPARRSDESYWQPIYAALDGDGPANLLHYLLAYQYDRALLFRPPMTKAKAEQAVESMDSVSQWWLEVLRGDRDPAAGRFTASEHESRPDGLFDADTSKDVVYSDYAAWCDTARRLKPVTSTQFWARFRKMAPEGFKVWKPHGGARVAWLPPRDLCREDFAAMVGCPWDDLDG